MVDPSTVEDLVDIADEFFDVVADTLTAHQRTKLLLSAPGFKPLKSDDSRLASFDPATLTVTEAFCVGSGMKRQSDASFLIVSRFPVYVPDTVKSRHSRSFGTHLLGLFTNQDTRPASGGWSTHKSLLPTEGFIPGLPLPDFMGVDSAVSLKKEQNICTLKIVVRHDSEILPLLARAADWLRAFQPAPPPPKDDPAGKHLADAALTALADLAGRRLVAQRRLAEERANYDRLTSQSEALMSAGDVSTVRRVLERRIGVRDVLAVLSAEFDELSRLMIELDRVARQIR